MNKIVTPAFINITKTCATIDKYINHILANFTAKKKFFLLKIHMIKFSYSWKKLTRIY